jgi:hypothetical protein
LGWRVCWWVCWCGVQPWGGGVSCGCRGCTEIEEPLASPLRAGALLARASPLRAAELLARASPLRAELLVLRSCSCPGIAGVECSHQSGLVSKCFTIHILHAPHTSPSMPPDISTNDHQHSQYTSSMLHPSASFAVQCSVMYVCKAETQPIAQPLHRQLPCGHAAKAAVWCDHACCQRADRRMRRVNTGYVA